MEIGTNELTRPFRIPRRKSGKNDDEKTASKSGPNESVQRSPLANPGTTRKNEASFSSRIVPPTKRKASQELRPGSAKKPTVNAPSGGEVFDKIIGNMVNPPKEKKAEPPKEREDLPGSSGVNNSKSSNSNVRRLTKEELERQVFDNSACYAFLRKEGLMERLLGHKMLTGRVDSYITLGYLPMDPSEQSFGRKSNFKCTKSFDDFPVICEPAPIAIAAEERRGPRTPPGSPGRQDNSSMVSSRGAGSATQSSHPPPPPPPVPIDEGRKEKHPLLREGMEKHDSEAIGSLAVMNQLEKCSHNQLAEFLVGELQNAMKQVDHKVLLSTLKDALMKVGKKNEETENARTSQSVKKEESANDSFVNPPVEMDIESDRSAAGEEPILLPPPPAPATPPLINNSMTGNIGTPVAHIVPPPPCILPTPPPPPPPPLVLQAAPPPPVILHQPPQTIVVQPTLPGPIILQQAPPAPIISQSNLRPSVHMNVGHFAASQSSTTMPNSMSATMPATFTRPPPMQRAVEKPLQQVSNVGTEIRTASPRFTSPSLHLSFTAPPPPVIVNTAIPPPNFNSNQQLPSLQSSCLTSEGSSTLRIQTSMSSQVPNQVLPLSSSAVMNTVTFLSNKPLTVTHHQVLSKTEETPPRPPMLPSHIDFSKPPPGAVSTSAQMPSTSTALNSSGKSFTGVSCFSRLPTTSGSSMTNANIRLSTSSNMKQVRNLTFIKTLPDTSNSVSGLPSTSHQIQQSSNLQNNIFTPSSVRINADSHLNSVSLSQQQSSLGQTNTLSSTPTSENVIKTLLHALALPQKSQQALSSQKQNSPIRPTMDVSNPPPSANHSSQNHTSGLLDRLGNPSSVLNRSCEEIKPAVVAQNQNSIVSTNSTSENVITSQKKPQSSFPNTEKDAENKVVKQEMFLKDEKQSGSVATANKSESDKDVKFFPPVKEATVLRETPISFFGSPAVSSKKPGHERAPIPPPSTAPPRPRLDGPPNSIDKPLPPVPAGFIPPRQMRPRFPPVPMPFRMRGPFPFPLRRPPPPYGPIPPGFRMLRPRFNR